MRGGRRDTGSCCALRIPASDLIPAIYSLEMQVYSHAPTCLMTKVLFSEPSNGL